MHEIALLLALASLGVDYGWTVSEDGQAEYIIQIEPPLLQALLAGESITSQVDPRVSNVRRFRIRVGNEPLAQEVSPPAALVTDSARPLDSSGGAEQGVVPSAAGGRDELAAETPPDPADTPMTPAPAAPTNDAGRDGPPSQIPSPDGSSTDGPGVRGTRFELDPDPDGTPEGDESAGVGNEPPQDESPILGAAAIDNTQHQQETGFYADQRPSARVTTKPNSTALPDAPIPVANVRDDESARPANGPPRRWLPLVLTLLALFASIGLNLYLGWNTWDTYRRYQSLVAEVRGVGSQTPAS